MDDIFEKMTHLCNIAREQEPVYRARIVAGIWIRNKLIALGQNSYKTHPFQARFSKHEESIYLHAEVDAIKNALYTLDVDDLRKSTLYVARMKWREGGNSEMIPGMARPCDGCKRAIATFEIPEVYYTLDEYGFDSL
jgi:deoxycytidylate deaminase